MAQAQAAQLTPETILEEMKKNAVLVGDEYHGFNR
jgi:hypothetical protein